MFVFRIFAVLVFCILLSMLWRCCRHRGRHRCDDDMSKTQIRRISSLIPDPTRSAACRKTSDDIPWRASIGSQIRGGDPSTVVKVQICPSNRTFGTRWHEHFPFTRYYGCCSLDSCMLCMRCVRFVCASYIMYCTYLLARLCNQPRALQ